MVAFKSDLLTLREARAKMKLGPLMDPVLDEATGEPVLDENGEPTEKESPFNDMLYTQLPGVAKGGTEATGGGIGGEVEEGGLTPALQSRDPALGLVVSDVRELITQGRDVHDRLQELAAVVQEQGRREKT